MRYERKFEVPLGHCNVISTFLLSQGFKEIFKERKVNSIYYDDYDFSNYQNSENGIKDRTKIRARYYDSGKDGFNLEYKLKNDNLNWKIFKTSNPNEIGSLFPVYIAGKEQLFNEIKLPSSINTIFKPKVLVSYLRKYFLSRNQNLRITIDFQIKFFSSKLSNNRIDIGIERNHFKDVLEIKYQESISSNYDFIDFLCQEFNFDLSRSSKYCYAINSIFN